jgi:hypothetical protein
MHASTRWPSRSILSMTIPTLGEAVLPLPAPYVPANRKIKVCAFCMAAQRRATRAVSANFSLASFRLAQDLARADGHHHRPVIAMITRDRQSGLLPTMRRGRVPAVNHVAIIWPPCAQLAETGMTQDQPSRIGSFTRHGATSFTAEEGE